MLVPAQITVVEGDKTVQVCANLSSIENTARDVSLVFKTTQVTGTCGCSYHKLQLK